MAQTTQKRLPSAGQGIGDFTEREVQFKKRISESIVKISRPQTSSPSIRSQCQNCSQCSRPCSATSTSIRPHLALDSFPMKKSETDSLRLMTHIRRRQIDEIHRLQKFSDESQTLLKYSRQMFEQASSTRCPCPPSRPSTTSKALLSAYSISIEKEPSDITLQRPSTCPASSSVRKSALMNDIRIHPRKNPIQFYHDRVAQEIIQEGGKLPTKHAIVPIRWPPYYFWDAPPTPRVATEVRHLSDMQTRFMEQQEAEDKAEALRKRIEKEMVIEAQRGEEEEEGESKDEVKNEDTCHKDAAEEKELKDESEATKGRSRGSKRPKTRTKKMKEEPEKKEEVLSPTLSTISSRAKREIENDILEVRRSIEEYTKEFDTPGEGVLTEGPATEATLTEVEQTTAGVPTMEKKEQLPPVPVETPADVSGKDPLTEQAVEGAVKEEDQIEDNRAVSPPPDLPPFACPSSEDHSKKHAVREWLNHQNYLPTPKGVSVL